MDIVEKKHWKVEDGKKVGELVGEEISEKRIMDVIAQENWGLPS